MPQYFTVILFLFTFTFAEGQTGTIKVKKNNCNCPVMDTVAVRDIDLQPDKGKTITIKGLITDTLTGKALSKVSIYYEVGKKKVHTTTDEKGAFIITGPPGAYLISVRVPCYYIKRSEIGPYPSDLVECDIWMYPCEAIPPPGGDTKGKH